MIWKSSSTCKLEKSIDNKLPEKIHCPIKGNKVVASQRCTVSFCCLSEWALHWHTSTIRFSLWERMLIVSPSYKKYSFPLHISWKLIWNLLCIEGLKQTCRQNFAQWIIECCHFISRSRSNWYEESSSCLQTSSKIFLIRIDLIASHWPQCPINTKQCLNKDDFRWRFWQIGIVRRLMIICRSSSEKFSMLYYANKSVECE